MHKKKMFNLENEGHGHGVQQSQWCHSMANIQNLYKIVWLIFAKAKSVMVTVIFNIM